MDNPSEVQQFELCLAIVNFGTGSKVVHIAKQNGLTGGTIILGKGTAKSSLLKLLDLAEVRKEIVLMIGPKPITEKTVQTLCQRLQFEKPSHGIAFTMPLTGVIGSRNRNCSNLSESRGVQNTMHKAIFTVVDKGKAETLIEAANKAGARGATIINARGAGSHEYQRLFAMDIEPEKEMVLILSETALTETIVNAIRSEMRIDEPGNGILFILDVNQAHGLR
ncbi:MAG TPA: P-II family nitrogen regulator [Bacillota bacterium]|nr:P-II family nitrogen regulator [Bacillota bacterium]HPT87302.1 P-II family nitrogen regulator [Bacillota bacterium]